MAYTTLATMRTVDGVGDSSVYSDAQVNEAITFAKFIVDDATGTTFGDVTAPAYDSFSLTLTGTGTRWLALESEDGKPLVYPRTISSATISGVADSGVTYTVHPDGLVYRDTGAWSTQAGGRNIVIAGTAGYTDDPPEAIKWACRMIARDRLFHNDSRNSDRALSVTTPDGFFTMNAQAGRTGRDTAMPDVNAVLNRYRQVW